MKWVVKVRAGSRKNCISFTLDIEAEFEFEARQKALSEGKRLANPGEHVQVVQVTQNG